MLSRVNSFCKNISVGASNVVCSSIMSDVLFSKSEWKDCKSGSRIIRDLDSSSWIGVYNMICGMIAF